MQPSFCDDLSPAYLTVDDTSVAPPVGQLSSFLDVLLPMPPSTPSVEEYTRKLANERPVFFFMLEIPHSHIYIAIARSGRFATFDSASLCCIMLGSVCCEPGNAPPPIHCAAVTTGYSCPPIPITVETSNHHAQLSSPRRRPPPPPRGDVLAVVTCHSVIWLYDLAAMASGNYGIGVGGGSNTNVLFPPILKISLGFEVLPPICVARCLHPNQSAELLESSVNISILITSQILARPQLSQ
jgi:hypothetical protein